MVDRLITTWPTSSIRIQLQWFQQPCSPYSLQATSPFAVCMTLPLADNLFSGTLLLMPYRSEVVSHPPWHLRKARSAWHRRGPMSTWHLWMNISDLCSFITGVASFRYEIDISLPLVGVRRNRRTIRSVSSESTTVTLALYSMSRRSEGLSGQATRSALTFSYSNTATL